MGLDWLRGPVSDADAWAAVLRVASRIRRTATWRARIGLPPALDAADLEQDGLIAAHSAALSWCAARGAKLDYHLVARARLAISCAVRHERACLRGGSLKRLPVDVLAYVSVDSSEETAALALVNRRASRLTVKQRSALAQVVAGYLEREVAVKAGVSQVAISAHVRKARAALSHA